MVTMPSSLRDADVRTRSDSIFAQAALYKVKDRHDGRDSGPTGQACSFGLLAGRPAPTPGWPLGSSLAVAFPLPAACSKVSSRQQTGPLILRTRQRKSGDHGDKSWKSDRRRDIKQAGGGFLGVTGMMIRDPQGDPPPPCEDAPSKPGLGPISHPPPLKYPPAPSSTGPRLPVVFTFYHHLRPKGLVFATSPFPSPSLHLLRVSQTPVHSFYPPTPFLYIDRRSLHHDFPPILPFAIPNRPGVILAFSLLQNAIPTIFLISPSARHPPNPRARSPRLSSCPTSLVGTLDPSSSSKDATSQQCCPSWL